MINDWLNIIDYRLTIISDYWRLLASIDDYWQLTTIIGDYWRLLGIINNQQL